MKWGIISKTIIILATLFVFASPSYAEMGMSGGEFVSPSYFLDDGKAADVRTKSDGKLEYEIYIPSEIVPNYRIHSNFNTKTDACASCHSTHTANGVSLLQWVSVSTACMACHDGTVTTTYNVEEGEFKDHDSAEYYPANGGCFANPNRDDKNMSMHNIDYFALTVVKNQAAPGGNRNPSESEIKKNGVKVSWDLAFTCAGCHNPHGEGGNARLLKPDVNGVAVQNEMTDIQMYEVSTDRKSWSVFPDIDNDNEPEKYLDNGQYSNSGYQQDFGKPVRALSVVTTYPYNKDIVIEVCQGNTVISRIFPTDAEIDNSSGASIFKFDRDISEGNKYIIRISKAYPGVTVGMRIDKYLKVGEFVEYKYGINAFCAACHTDYNTAMHKFLVKDSKTNYFLQYPSQYSYYSGSGGAKELNDGDGQSGEFSQAFRHQVGMVWDGKNKAKGLRFERDTWNPTKSIQGEVNGKMVVNCLTCHVAHGVSSDYWQMTIGSGEEEVSYDTEKNRKYYYDNPDNEEEQFPLRIFSNYELGNSSEEGEISGSSVLKRLPNMGVCEACHQKGKDAISNPVNQEVDFQ